MTRGDVVFAFFLLSCAAGCASVLGLDEGTPRDDVDAGDDSSAADSANAGDTVGGGGETSVDSGGQESSTDAGLDAPPDTAPACRPGEKWCGGGCVAIDDWQYGCAPQGCQSCGGPNVQGYGCDAGACSFACTPGWLDCNSAPGCESQDTSNATCGKCTIQCTGGLNCDPSTKFCANGCPVPKQMLACGCYDPTQDPTHCGGCNPCPAYQNSFPTCVGGVCGYQCIPPFPRYQDCPSTAPGCADTSSDTLNCGSCGNNCGARAIPPHGTGWSCSGGNCILACAPGYYPSGASCIPTVVDSGQPDTNPPPIDSGNFDSGSFPDTFKPPPPPDSG
jgi:hypothetical protein